MSTLSFCVKLSAYLFSSPLPPSLPNCPLSLPPSLPPHPSLSSLPYPASHLKHPSLSYQWYTDTTNQPMCSKFRMPRPRSCPLNDVFHRPCLSVSPKNHVIPSLRNPSLHPITSQVCTTHLYTQSWNTKRDNNLLIESATLFSPPWRPMTWLKHQFSTL